MLNLKRLKEGDRVSFKYPIHGTRNMLRNVNGSVDCVGKGVHDHYVTVNEDNGKTRSFSETRIVAR